MLLGMSMRVAYIDVRLSMLQMASSTVINAFAHAQELTGKSIDFSWHQKPKLGWRQRTEDNTLQGNEDSE